MAAGPDRIGHDPALHLFDPGWPTQHRHQTHICIGACAGLELHESDKGARE
jgi:hypothetical protein